MAHRSESSVPTPVRPHGLSAAEAAERLAEDGPNELPAGRDRGWTAQTLDVIRQPMILLLLGAASVHLLLGEPLETGLLLGSVLLVIGISVGQEHRTETALSALRDLSSPRALVVRDGEEVRIPGREVVRGDVILLGEGDRVPADALLMRAASLATDESMLTGEPGPIRKAAARDPDAPLARPGADEELTSVYSGTLVVRGHGMAVVRATGARSELGMIGGALGGLGGGRTPLQQEVDRLVRIIATIALAAVVIVVLAFRAIRGGWLEGLLAGIAAAMAMLPEEYPIVLTVFLALGAFRMSRDQVLARRTAVIETLGSVSVLCVDKTGTLTANRMRVAELVVDGHAHQIDGNSLPETVHELTEVAALASTATRFDPMDRALRTLADEALGIDVDTRDGWDIVREYPLREDLFATSTVWRTPDGSLRVATKGAPEAVLGLAVSDVEERAAAEAALAMAAEDGRRVLAVAVGDLPDSANAPSGQEELPLTLLGLVCLEDPVRDGVPESVAECSRAGVRTVMITGDHPATALAVARRIGLARTDRCLTGAELRALDDDALADAVLTVDVYARIVPDQKLRLVRTLQATGAVVGMTGDGVNDAPALAAADVGIAMGARGTDVAREAAALVITDDDFTSIVRGVRQGRGIFLNLRKAMAYIVAVHVPILGMTLLPVFSGALPLVLLPVQVAFLELIIDPACSIAFEAEEHDPTVMDQPPRGHDDPLLGRGVLTIAALQGLAVLAGVAAVYLWGVRATWDADVVRSATFVALVAGNLALILTNRSWRLSLLRTLVERRNPVLPWILAGAVALLVAVLGVPTLRDALGFGPLGATTAIVAGMAAAVGIAWFEVWKAVARARDRG